MRRFFTRFILGVLLLLIVLAAIVVIRAEQARHQKIVSIESKETISLTEKEKYAERLGKALTFRTISYQETQKNDWNEYQKFINYLEETFPNIHATLKRDIVNNYSLLYTWEGKDSLLSPVLFLAHYDVVPVEQGTENIWKYPPFSGTIADEAIWGRGALDVKSSLIGLLESVNYWIQNGYQPKRTLLFAFGHDEELGGRNGARKIAELLKERGIKPEFSLDEGMAINEGIIPGIEGPVALIGIAEKGYLSLELSVTTKGGHSSTPPDKTSIAILSAVIQKIEQHRKPAKLAGPIRWMLEDLAPYMNFPMRAVCSNLWLFSGILAKVLETIPSSNAALRTTFAPTLFHAGEKENVLPAKAWAVINIRMLPGDSSEEVINYVRKTINDDKVNIKPFSPEMTDEASPLADRTSDGYRTIVETIQEVWGNIPVASSLTLGGTDSTNYVGIVKNLYRFQPLCFTLEELELIHGTNEHVKIDNYCKGIEFYIHLLKKVGK